MRIVHINADPVDAAGGAAAAMRTMVESQRQAGNEVIVLSRADMTGAYRALHFAARVLMKLAFGHCYSGGLLPSGLGKRANGLKPDVVYLHRLQNGTLGMREILRIQAPKKWYFHDMWPLNGVCPYWKEELFALPMPRRMRWLDRRSRALKREIGRRAKDLEIVIASEWMKGEVVKSAAFANVPVRLEPLAISPIFRQVKESRPWKINRSKLLFVASSRVEDPVKGYDRLQAALALLPADIRGRINLKICRGLTQEELAREFCTAAALVLPSRQETFGLVKHEALACGCPVITFNETACPEGIVPGQTGWIASSEKELAEVLSSLDFR